MILISTNFLSLSHTHTHILFFILFFVPYKRVNCSGWGRSFRPLCLDEPLTLTRSHSCGLPQLYEAFEGWGSLGSIVGGVRVPAFVPFVLCECIWNAAAVLLVLSAFAHTGSLGSPSRQVVYHPG